MSKWIESQDTIWDSRDLYYINKDVIGYIRLSGKIVAIGLKNDICIREWYDSEEEAKARYDELKSFLLSDDVEIEKILSDSEKRYRPEVTE